MPEPIPEGFETGQLRIRRHFLSFLVFLKRKRYKFLFFLSSSSVLPFVKDADEKRGVDTAKETRD